MSRNPNNSASIRQCTKCRLLLSLDYEHFPEASDRPYGFGYLCRSCERDRAWDKNQRLRRVGRVFNFTDAQKERRKFTNQKYLRTDVGRAYSMAKAYQAYDIKRGLDNDITKHFMLNEIFTKNCTYCGDSERMGCDRIDNRRGHTEDNVVPACADCNLCRGDLFSLSEMKIIGAAIKEVRRLRRLSIENHAAGEPIA